MTRSQFVDVTSVSPGGGLRTIPRRVGTCPVDAGFVHVYCVGAVQFHTTNERHRMFPTITELFEAIEFEAESEAEHRAAPSPVFAGAFGTAWTDVA